MSLLPENLLPPLLIDRVLPAEILVAGGDDPPEIPGMAAAPAAPRPAPAGDLPPATSPAAPPLPALPEAAPPAVEAKAGDSRIEGAADAAAPGVAPPVALPLTDAPPNLAAADAQDEPALAAPAPFALPPEDAFPSQAELDAILAAHAGPPPEPDAHTRAEVAAWLGLDPALADDAALFNDTLAALPALDADTALQAWLGDDAALVLAWTGVPTDWPWP